MLPPYKTMLLYDSSYMTSSDFLMASTTALGKGATFKRPNPGGFEHWRVSGHPRSHEFIRMREGTNFVASVSVIALSVIGYLDSSWKHDTNKIVAYSIRHELCSSIQNQHQSTSFTIMEPFSACCPTKKQSRSRPIAAIMILTQGVHQTRRGPFQSSVRSTVGTSIVDHCRRSSSLGS